MTLPRRMETKRLNRWEKFWAFGVPWLRNMLGQQIPYLFFLEVTSKCNKRCGYCNATEPEGAFIDLNVAKQSIDFMHQKGCRVVALMGGEPLLLGDRLIRIISYTTRKRMFTYLPTNLSLLTETLLEDLINSGIGVIDVAVDVMESREGFPKSLEEVESNLNLVLKSRKRGVIVKLNTIITPANMDDVRQLVERSRTFGIPISLHLVEGAMPGVSQPKSEWLQDNLFSWKKEHYPELEELADWLIKKKKEGYWIHNPLWYFELMKDVVKEGKHSGWRCLAGGHTLFINRQGILAPCAALKGQNWGGLGKESWPLDKTRMEEQLTRCNLKCLSCCNTLTSHSHSRPLSLLWGYLWSSLRRAR